MHNHATLNVTMVNKKILKGFAGIITSIMNRFKKIYYCDVFILFANKF